MTPAADRAAAMLANGTVTIIRRDPASPRCDLVAFGQTFAHLWTDDPDTVHAAVVAWLEDDA